MIHCFYHSSDLDGHCSGAIVKYKFPEAQMHSINYGQQFAWDKVNTKEDVIIMVDFSLQPFVEMAKLYTEFGDRLIWIDHHISAVEEAKNWKDGEDNKSLNDKINGLRMVGLAGCELTWKHFFPEIEMPNAVRLLGRYDVWDHKDPNVLPFQTCLCGRIILVNFQKILLKIQLMKEKRFSSIKNRRMKNTPKAVLWKLISKDSKLLQLINF